MGSVCCVAARPKDLTRSSDGWSLEQSRSHWRNHGALSPPLSSRWEQKWHSSESASAQNSLRLHQASFSSSRSGSHAGSGSRVGSGDFFGHSHETLDGLLYVYNSPESIHRSQGVFGIAGDPMTDQTLRLSPASSQETSVSFESATPKIPEELEHRLRNRQSQAYGLSTILSRSDFLSRQRADGTFSYGASSKVVPMEMETLRHRTRGSSIDGLHRLRCEKADSWTAQTFSELIESSRSGSSRWPSADISSESIVGGMPESSSGGPGMRVGSSQCEVSRRTSGEVQKCGLCTKAISERSPWSTQYILGNRDLPVIGVLVCGHVYHAECLEQATPLMQWHDPPCPLCGGLEKVRLKAKEEGNWNLKTQDLSEGKGKICKEGMASDRFAGISNNNDAGYSGKSVNSLEPTSKKHEPSRTAEKGFLAKPLLKRQFSFRGKSTREPAIGSKKPGYAARVSPENTVKEESSLGDGRKGKFWV